MKVIVDTAIWSLALRRQPLDQNQGIVCQLQGLIQNNQVIRQEVLSGIKSLEQFERLRSSLRVLPDLELCTED